MSITRLFEKIGAPLANQRWSWGAIRPSDGCVALRVWIDELKLIGDYRYARITWFDKFIDDQENPGYKERLAQIEHIKNGSPTIMIICTPKEGKDHPKVIQSFNDQYLFTGGKLLQFEGDWWLQMISKVPIRDLQIQ